VTTRALAIVVLLAACATDDTETLDVFAASSLTDAFGAIETAFEEDHDVDVVLNLAASSALREQILAGAPADVFASANHSNIDAVADDSEVFATNRLQIVVPRGNPGGVDGIDDLARDDLLVGLCAVEVPCGELAHEALDLAGVAASVDTEEPDVRSLLAKVVGGELDVGIVYRTDVLAAGDAVRGIDLDVAATYPIAALTEGGRAFVEFVLSSEGQAILAEHGFGGP
jgi:molybdate transport system substrate-binding protein